MFAGTYTALVTTFRHGQVDTDGFRQLIEAQTNQMQLSWRLTILADGGPRLPGATR